MKDAMESGTPEMVRLTDVINVPPPISFRTDSQGLRSVLEMHGHQGPEMDKRIIPIAQRIVYESLSKHPELPWPMNDRVALATAKELLGQQ